MITLLDDMPDGVLGFRLSGEIHAADYTSVLIPAVEAAAERGDIRAVVVAESFDKMTGGALFEDTKLGMHHLSKWKRTAFVSDLDWMNHLVAVFGWMAPGQVRHYPVAELDDAVAWAAASD